MLIDPGDGGCGLQQLASHVLVVQKELEVSI